MKKPTVYLDTNIISAYWYEGADVAAAARRFHTNEWWERERERYKAYVSAITINELRAGKYRRQLDCVKMARTLPRLPITGRVRRVFDELVLCHLVPESKPGDAFQLAVATAHELDYLLTWNYAHLANPVAQEQLERLCGELDLKVPLLVSPETIPQVQFGQEIRRKRET